MSTAQTTAKISVSDFVDALKEELMGYVSFGGKVTSADQISCFNDVLRVNFRQKGLANLPQALQKFYANDMKSSHDYETLVTRLDRLVRIDRGAR